MSRQPRWSDGSFEKGVKKISLSSWKYFSDYVNQELLDYTTYIYRGHANSAWKLEPTLDRVVSSPVSSKRASHLDNFKYAVRGRRGPNPPIVIDDNGWWALGQHHGLMTPLLDWTVSPFVALFFAISMARQEKSSSCCVWALSQSSIDEFNKKISQDDSIKPINGRKPIVELIRPLSDENSRLVSQRGLFSRGPNNIDLESWIRTYHEDGKSWDLIKITIPNTGLNDCLRYLNRMNINLATLFPDLFGASNYCNMALEITKY